jgi:hypothetical protein
MYASMLTVGQQRVITAVLNAPDSVYARSAAANRDEIFGVYAIRDDLYFVLPGGVLGLFFANPKYPTAEYPLNWANCPVVGSGDCRQAVHIIGSKHLFYYPACLGGPGDTPFVGQRRGPVMAGENYTLDPMDFFAIKAYRENGVTALWEQSDAFWDRAAANRNGQ